MKQQVYDIFISYAREDAAWVEANLYKPLLACQTADKRRPVIFYDVSEDGVIQGQSFVDALAEAIQNSQKVIPVYSKTYFKKSMAAWELKKVFQLDAGGQKGKINPILIEPGAAEDIPFYINDIQYLDVATQSDWFSRLVKNLDLTPQPEKKSTRLDFLNQPQNITVNHTLPPVVIAIKDDNGIKSVDDLITLSAEPGELLGTLTLEASKGKAAFVDLSFGSAVASTRLFAKSEGHQDAMSQSFAVINLQQEAIPINEKSHVEDKPVHLPLPADEIFFFESDLSLGLMEGDRLHLFRINGEKVTGFNSLRKIKILQGSRDYVALADWYGDVVVIRANGQITPHSLGANRTGFCIPGDMIFNGEELWIGFWNGEVYRIVMGRAAELVFVHPAGIQKLALHDNNLFLIDQKGAICQYLGDKLVQSHSIEPDVLLCRPGKQGLIAISEKKLYLLRPQQSQLLDEKLPFDRASAAFASGEHLYVMDASGKGFVYNHDFAIVSRFHTKQGALPVSHDQQGLYCIFRYPDGARTLMVKQRIVLSHLNGPFAVSPSGKYFASGDSTGVTIFDEKTLLTQFEGDGNEPAPAL